MTANPASLAMPTAIARASAELITIADPFHPRAEALRGLRTSLLPSLTQEAGSAVAIVSTHAGEGRSLLAAELAVLFAQLEVPVLLLETDLRRPRLARLFGCPPGRGWPESVAAREPLTPFRVEGYTHLDVLPVSGPTPAALEVLTRPDFGPLLEGLASRYRFVILDTPALEDTSDALVIASHAHLSLFLTRLGVTRTQPAREALRRLKAAGARVLGAVQG